MFGFTPKSGHSPTPPEPAAPSPEVKGALKKGSRQKDALKQQLVAVRTGGISRRERIVLLVGDEGAVLAHVKKNKLINRMFSPNPVAAETQNMDEMLKRAPRVPFYIVFDTMDQSYVQQSLPPVTALSVNKLVARRLERDFSGDYIKGAFLLGREKEGSRDWHFMMSALQQTLVVKGWLDVATEWPNPCRGILLLPAESPGLFNRLQTALRKHRGALENKAPDWQILVTYNKVSGIRQMVFQNGRLALTRLSQPAVDSTVETIAGTIEQEIISTKDYLKRLSTQVEGGMLHVLILGAEDICRHIDVKKLQVTHVEAVTPFQAAEMLQLEGAALPTDRFSDSLLCAMLCSSAKPCLTLNVPALRGQKIFTRVRYAQRVLSTCIAGVLLFSIGGILSDMYALGDDLSALRKQQTIKSQALEGLKKKLPRSPEEMERIITIMELVHALEHEAYAPDHMIQTINQQFSQRIHIAGFDWELRDAKAQAARQLPAAALAKSAAAAKAIKSDAPQLAVALTLEFPANIAADRVRLQQETTDILNQFKGRFPVFQVEYTALPSLISDTGRIDVDLSQQQMPAAAKPQDAKPEQAQTQAKLELIGPADMGEDNGGSQTKTVGR